MPKGFSQTVCKDAPRLQGHDDRVIGPEAEVLCNARRRRAKSDERGIATFVRGPEENKRKAVTAGQAEETRNGNRLGQLEMDENNNCLHRVPHVAVEDICVGIDEGLLY